VLGRYVWPPLSRSLEQRQNMVQKQVEDAEEAARRFKQAEERYEEALAEARTEAAKIRDQARADGEHIREELREQANAEVERIRQRGEEQLATQREQVVRQLRGELGALSVQLAEQLVGHELADDENRRSTVDSFLEQLDRLPTESSASGTSIGTGEQGAGGRRAATPAQPGGGD
jgi:ATP synthase F0 subunit b